MASFLYISNLEINGLDAHFRDRSNACLNSQQKCCSLSQLNGSLQNENCNLLNKKSYFTNKYQYNSLFVLEALFDKENKTYPEFIMENCVIRNLLAYDENFFIFSSFLKISSFGGKVLLKEISFQNIYFIRGLIFNDDDRTNHDLIFAFSNFSEYFQAYRLSMGNENETLSLQDLVIENFNVYSFEDEEILTNIQIMYMTQWEGSIRVNNLSIETFYGSILKETWIFKIEFCSGDNIIENNNFHNLRNVSFLYVENSNMQISNIQINDIELIYTMIFVANIQNIFAINNCFFKNMTNSNSLKTSIFSFENSVVIINRTYFDGIMGMAIAFKNSFFFCHESYFTDLIFNGGYIQIENTTTLINSSTFHLLTAINNIFLLEKCESFINSQTSFTKVQTKTLFMCKNVYLLSLVNGFFFQFSDLDWVFSRDSTISIFLLFGYNLTNFTYSGGFLSIKNKINLKIENSYFKYFRAVGSSEALLRVFSGGFYVYNSTFLDILGCDKSYGIFINLYSNNAFINTTFNNIGWNFPYISSLQGKIISDNVHLIWLWNCYEITLMHCEFHNDGPFSLFTGFLYFLINHNPIIITDCKFIATNKIKDFYYMGMVISESTDVTFNNNYFEGLSCSTEQFFDHCNGPVGFFVTPSYVRKNNKRTFVGRNNSFVNCSCRSGGSLSLINFNTVDLMNFSFANSNAKYGGSFLIISSSIVKIQGISLLNSYAEKSGLFLVKNIDNLIMRDCVMNNSYTKYESSISLANIENFLLENASIHNLYSNLHGGFLRIVKANIIINNVLFFNISAKGRGGVIEITYGNLTLNNVSASLISSNAGSFIYCNSAEIISLVKVVVVNCFSSFSGSILFINEIQKLIAEDFIGGFSVSNLVGIFYLKSTQSDGKYFVKNLTCYNNFAVQGSCIYHESSNNFTAENIKIFNCENNLLSFSYHITAFVGIQGLILQNCRAETDSLVRIYFVDFYLENINCSNNQAQNSFFNVESSNFFAIQNANLENMTLLQGKLFTIFNVFNSSLELNGLIIKYEIIATLIKASNSKIYLKHSHVSNMLYIFPKSLLFIESSFVQCEDTLFFMNLNPIFNLLDCDLILLGSQIILNGVFVLDTNIENIDISINNEYSNVIRSVQIYDSLFNKENGLVIYAIGSQFFLFKNSTIFQKNSLSTMNVQGIYLIDFKAIEIMNSTFFNLSHEMAASLFIESTDYSSKKELNPLIISNSKFQFCQGKSFGVMIIKGNYDVSIENSNFENNTVGINNGNEENVGFVAVLYFICKKQIACQLSIRNSNFINNFASRYIATVFSEAPLNAKNNILINNTAKFDNWQFLSSFSIEIKIIENTSNKSEQTEIIPSFQSGSRFSLGFEITDNFGQSFLFDNFSIATLKASSEMNRSTIQNGVAQSKNGFLNFSNLVIKHPALEFLTIELDITIITFDKEILKLQKKFTLLSRKCYPGEILLSDFTCKKCPPNYYSLEDPMNSKYSPQMCNSCPQNADCPGGRYFIPKPGYWRFDNKTTYIVPCLLENACLGRGNINVDLNENIQEIDDVSLTQGKCQLGHQGNLCYNCIYEYGKFESGELCQKCGSYSLWNYSRMVFFLFFVLIYLFLNARSMTNSSSKVIDLILKMILNHSQRISLIVGKDFLSFENAFNDFFKSFNFLSFLTEDLFSNDCFMQIFTTDMDNLFILKIFVSVMMPIIVSLICFFILLILSSFISSIRKNGFTQKLLLIFLISIFLFYPLIIKCSLSLIHCIPLDNLDYIKQTFEKRDRNEIYFLYSSPNIQCWQGKHKQYYILAGILGIALWGCCFPIFIALIIRKSLKSAESNPKTVKIIVSSQILGPIPNNDEHVISMGFNMSKKKQENFFQEKSKTELGTADPINIHPKKCLQKKNSFFTENEKQNHDLFKFFYKDYRKNYYYWESILFLQKFSLSLLPNINEFLSEEVIDILCLVIFLIYLNFLNKEPFLVKTFNKVEKFSIFISIMMRFSLSLSKNLQMNSIGLFFIVLCVILNAAFFIITFYYLYKLPNWKETFVKASQMFKRTMSSLNNIRNSFTERRKTLKK